MDVKQFESSHARPVVVLLIVVGAVITISSVMYGREKAEIVIAEEGARQERLAARHQQQRQEAARQAVRARQRALDGELILSGQSIIPSDIIRGHIQGVIDRCDGNMSYKLYGDRLDWCSAYKLELYHGDLIFARMTCLHPQLTAGSGGRGWGQGDYHRLKFQCKDYLDNNYVDGYDMYFSGYIELEQLRQAVNDSRSAWIGRYQTASY